VKQAGDLAAVSTQRSMLSLYFGAVQRFVLVLALLAVGMGYLKLAPLPLLASFAIAQLAYALAAGRQATGTTGNEQQRTRIRSAL
jgi:ATP synthase protein I